MHAEHVQVTERLRHRTVESSVLVVPVDARQLLIFDVAGDRLFDQALFVGEQPVDFKNIFELLQGILFFFSQPGAFLRSLPDPPLQTSPFLLPPSSLSKPPWP